MPIPITGKPIILKVKDWLNCCSIDSKESNLVAPWCSGYRYCTTSFNKAWAQVLRRFQPCSRRVRDLLWWRSLTMVPAGNKAICLSSVNHTTKTIHHHYKRITFAINTTLDTLLLRLRLVCNIKTPSKWRILYIICYGVDSTGNKHNKFQNTLGRKAVPLSETKINY